MFFFFSVVMPTFPKIVFGCDANSYFWNLICVFALVCNNADKACDKMPKIKF